MIAGCQQAWCAAVMVRLMAWAVLACVFLGVVQAGLPWLRPLGVIGGLARTLRGLVGGRGTTRQLGAEGGGEEFDWRKQELEAENEILREQIHQLKRLAMSQKDYANRLRKDKEALRRLLETTEERVTEQFMSDKAEALRELHEKHEAERRQWKSELQAVKVELAVKSKSLDNAMDTIADIKAKLRAAAAESETKSAATSTKAKAESSTSASARASKRDRTSIQDEEGVERERGTSRTSREGKEAKEVKEGRESKEGGGGGANRAATSSSTSRRKLKISSRDFPRERE